MTEVTRASFSAVEKMAGRLRQVPTPSGQFFAESSPDYDNFCHFFTTLVFQTIV